MNQETFTQLNKFIEKKASGLSKHESKDFAKLCFDDSNYREFSIEGRQFYMISTRVFREIIYRVLPLAVEQYPNKFGQNSTDEIIEALYLVEPFGRLENYANLLQTEQFAWVLEIKEGAIEDKVLRVDLFRMIEEGEENGKTIFTGGVFHAYRHFSYKGVPLSTSREVNDLSFPALILTFLIRAFFIEGGSHINESHFESKISIDDKSNLKCKLYFESVNKVYFIKTIHKEKK